MFPRRERTDLFAAAVALLLASGVSPLPARAQAGDGEAQALEKLERRFERLQHRLDELEKVIDDVLWYHRFSHVAFVDKVRQVGPPPAGATVACLLS